MKVLITGSRQIAESAENLQILLRALDAAHVHYSCWADQMEYPTHLLHGGAMGADQLAKAIIQKLNLEETELVPDYKRYAPTLAPLKRNDELVQMADMTIAFYAPNQQKKGGTWYTAQKTLLAGKPLLEILPSGELRWTAPAPKLF